MGRWPVAGICTDQEAPSTSTGIGVCGIDTGVNATSEATRGAI